MRHWARLAVSLVAAALTIGLAVGSADGLPGPQANGSGPEGPEPSAPEGGVAASTQAAPIAVVDSVWVWQSVPAAVLAAHVSELSLSRVFLFVGNADREADQNIRRSVQLLHADGVQVYALSGEPAWTFRHAAAVAWAHRALRLAPFDGLHLDVEPHALRNWKREQQRLVADYLALLDRLSPMTGPLGVDVQFAYGKIATPGGSTFADDILAKVDEVTVMSYRDTAFGNNSFTEIATDWLERATAAEKDVWLAAETNELADCPYCTFYEEGQARMADVLEAVDGWARPQFPTYRGVAIEDLDGWLALGP